MNALTRRKLLITGSGAIAGAADITAAARIAEKYGLIPPDHGGLYGPGATLTYACQRVLTLNRPMREFPRSMISTPFVSPFGKLPAAYHASKAHNFADWRVAVDGLVTHPLSLSIADLRALAVRSQITEIACEEGWSYIAEWIGTPLSLVLREAGVKPEARYVAYFSIQDGLWDSLDVPEANHPGTLLTWGMNGGDLPVDYGAPVRIRVPRQIGYKSVKFLTRITVTDSLKRFGETFSSSNPTDRYAWYAGI